MRFQVKTPSRLHFGLIDLQGVSGRKFGGFGLGIKHPNTHLQFSSSSTLQIKTNHPLSSKITKTWKILKKKFQLKKSAKVEIINAPRAHSGFGSGTQIVLATAVGFLRINDLSVSIDDLALLLGRGKRSAIGLTVFKRGGLVVDGGIPATLKPAKSVPKPSSLPILLARHSLPKDWRLVIVIPKKFQGISGRKEKQAFRNLNPSNLHQVQKISQALLLKLLPAILEKDIRGFGEALTSIQRWVGEQFKPAQYSQFGNPVSEKLIRQLLKWGVAGSGQSSWGPVVYGLVEGNREAKRVQLKLEEKYPSDFLTVLISEADNRGYRVIE